MYQNSNINSCSTLVRSFKVSLCPICESPRKCIPNYDGEHFYFCAPCDSVRDSLFEEEENVEYSVNAPDRTFLGELFELPPLK